MPRYIMRIGDLYGEWSTIVDAPVTALGTRDQFRDYYEREYGRSSMREFEERMALADAKGTSSRLDDSAESVMRLNRFGRRQRRISVAAVIAKWKRESREMWAKQAKEEGK